MNVGNYAYCVRCGGRLGFDSQTNLGYTLRMSQTNVFKSNKTQAVRLPKPVALPEHVKRVEVIRQGSGRLLVPAGTGWDQFYSTPGIDGDFLKTRNQPPPQFRKG